MNRQTDLPDISNKLNEKFRHFIEYTPAGFSRQLRQLLLWYMVYEEDIPAFDLSELSEGLIILFEMMDVVEDERKSPST